jgi:hypothetical protein
MKQFILSLGSASHVLGALLIIAVFVVPLTLCRVRSAHWIAAAVAIGYYTNGPKE